MYKVYIKVDANNVITDITSNMFLSDVAGWIEIDQGDTSKYARAQVEYLQKGLIDLHGRYNYKYINGYLCELSDDEKDSLYPVETNRITTEDRIVMLEEAMQELILAQLGGE